jgi:hypothetical protein
MRCPYCKERIRKGAVRCKHCHAVIGNDGNTASSTADDGFKYLQNGFAKIYSECEAIEDKIKMRTGLVFVKHQYTSDDLLEAISRIESFVEKMRDDLGEWESANKLAAQVKDLFNRKAEDVYHRLESLHVEIERREPTWWEKVSVFFSRIFEKLFTFFTFKLISGKLDPKEIGVGA